MPKTTAIYCPACNFYNQMAQPSAHSHYQSGALTRHGKMCGQQVFVINNPMPEKRWNKLNQTIQFLLEELDTQEPDKTTTRYVDKTLDWLTDFKQSYLKDSVPMEFKGPGNVQDFAGRNKMDVSGSKLVRQQ